MLRELLFALQGHTGGIFTYTKDDGITVNKSLPFLNPSEIYILDQLCTLGTYYKIFREYCDSDDRLKRGLYLQVFCKGLDRILDNYRHELNNLEKEVLRDPHISLSYFQYSLDEYHLLFPALIKVIEQIKCQKSHGCQILELLYKASFNGMTVVQNAIKSLLYLCQGVLCKQLAAWMLNGILLDPCNEFFIQNREIGIHNVNEACDESLIQETQESDIVTTRYQLCPEMLPTHIPLTLAEKILFVGRSVILFDKHGSKGGLDRETIFNTKEDEFSNLLLNLHEKDKFSLTEFNATVNLIRSFAAEQLWCLFVEKADFLTYLRTMRDVFLLGRGELFLTFIHKADHLLRKAPARNSEHAINSAFRAAVHDAVSMEDTTLDIFNLTLKVPTEDGGATSSQVSGWSCISISCRVPHMLQIFFTPPLLDKYNRIFQFLLTIRRVQLELHNCWAIHMQNMKSAQRESSHTVLMQTRNDMSCFVDNLQYYLQVDVVESQFSIMMNEIRNIRDFEAVQHAHEVFLSTVFLQSFLNENPKKPSQVYLTLRAILKQCIHYCSLAANYSGSLSEEHRQDLSKIRYSFFLLTSKLFSLLPNISRNQDNPSLAQFMMRIDYNNYFSSIKLKSEC